MQKALIVAGIAVVVVALAARGSRDGSAAKATSGARPVLATTSRDGLTATIENSRARAEANPGDGEAAVLLADALLRAARVDSDPSLALEAESVLRATLAHRSDDYGARRMLGVVYLAQHRFADALRVALEAQQLQPRDAWNYAVAGDALLELGRYEEAFDAFDDTMARRPDAAAYARVAYARELQGDIEGAVRLMRMAGESTSAADLEARAWSYAQLGSLYLLGGQLDAAEREYNRADFTFPSHPYAAAGRVRLLVARGQHREALAAARRLAETPEALAIRGDLHASLGDTQAAEDAYRRAEQLERDGWKHEQPQPAALARFLAERGRDIPVAVTLAETAIAERQDIHSLDALAWAYFQAGRLDEAHAAIAAASKTGTVDPRIRCHAAQIAAARTGSVTPSPRHCAPLALMAAPAEAIRLAGGRVESSERR